MNDDLIQQPAASLKKGGTVLLVGTPLTEPQQPTFEQRAARGNMEDRAEILAKAPDDPSAPGDEL